MLEKYLHKILADRVGRYIRNLDADQLRVAAWKGAIEVSEPSIALNLPLDGCHMVNLSCFHTSN
jgi:N-terminal region of Chorein or VPS13